MSAENTPKLANAARANPCERTHSDMINHVFTAARAHTHTENGFLTKYSGAAESKIMKKKEKRAIFCWIFTIIIIVRCWYIHKIWDGCGELVSFKFSCVFLHSLFAKRMSLPFLFAPQQNDRLIVWVGRAVNGATICFCFDAIMWLLWLYCTHTLTHAVSEYSRIFIQHA